MALPSPIACFIDATNKSDLEGMVAAFADDALINDQFREYKGKSAIREWAETIILNERLTITVVDFEESHSNCVVIANIDGNFDKRGLPEPLVLSFYFTLDEHLIVQLIMLRNQI
jgi:hypothetical protein